MAPRIALWAARSGNSLACMQKPISSTLLIGLAMCGVCVSATTAPVACPPAPMQVVQAYADAANRGDLEAFIALYAPDVRKYRYPGVLSSQGREEMRKVYARAFAEKRGIHVEIISMTALGDKVVSRDRVTGLPGGKSAEELTVYRVEGGLISEVLYIDKLELDASPR